MRASSYKFFTAFYDAVSPLLRTSKPCTSLLPLCRGRHNISGRRTSVSGHRPFGHIYPAWGPKSRYVVSRGFAGFCAWTSVPTTGCPASAASTAVAESATSSFDTRLGYLKSQRWTQCIRCFHTERYKRGAVRPQMEGKNTSKSDPTTGKLAGNERFNDPGIPKKLPEESRILTRIYHIHRPTKDEMLAAATGVFQRLRIRTKWSLIRQMRPYNWEDLSAFFSWLFLGHVIWIVAGTTTFMSLTIVLINSVFAQETLAGAIGNYLTKETGVKIVFESAIVPRWKDNCISFKNVFVSRRPGHQNKRNVRKGSPETAAAAAAAAVTADSSNLRDGDNVEPIEEDTNYTQFDVTIESVNVTLSFARWMNGKGLLKDVEIRGVRGVIDRTHVQWDRDVDPRSYRRDHSPGDFEIESFKLEDLLVTVHQPSGFRPFSISVFSCDLPQLRKQWLFYDFLSANNVSGSYDDSLFTIHPRQSHNRGSGNGNQNLLGKTSRLRIDGLEIDHLNRGIEGPFSWIQHGNVDIVADVVFPGSDDLQFSRLVQDIYERMEATVTSSGPLVNGVKQAILAQGGDSGQKPLVMDLHIQLKDVRATVPIFTNDLSYVNNALIRPIVAYINTRKTYIPINCRVVKRLGEFDGSWTMFDSGLMDDLSAEVLNLASQYYKLY
ncbi:hypothetical protein EDC01DRAFT_754907 [Geopyxis carbonaria]|nr:hypothetical protein EDC01DRAFT_754907 [Geopyxis carbonaria]